MVCSLRMNIMTMWAGWTICVRFADLVQCLFMRKIMWRKACACVCPYCFVDHRYPGVPDIPLQEISVGQAFSVNHTEVLPLRVMHGRLPILGYRIGQLGYITDMLTMPEESYEQLAGIDVLVVNALRIATHPTHQNLEEALAVAQRIQAKKTYFIHMSHDMGLHAEIEKSLPENIHLAFDGLDIYL